MDRDGYGGQNSVAGHNPGYAPSYGPPPPGGPSGCVLSSFFPTPFTYRLSLILASQHLVLGESIMIVFVICLCK